jgi:hypothetical protein
MVILLTDEQTALPTRTSMPFLMYWCSLLEGSYLGVITHS